MLKKLTLENFKNFRRAELSLGPFTLLIGENATGKSNLRDAFRFLHGVARGYSLYEITGEKWGEGGELVWKGVRGGSREIAFIGATTLALQVSFTLQDENVTREVTYRIEIEVPRWDRIGVVAESLVVEGRGDGLFRAVRRPGDAYNRYAEILPISVWVSDPSGQHQPLKLDAPRHYPVLTQIVGMPEPRLDPVRPLLRQTIRELRSMRFFDFEVEALRRPSAPGLTVLGDRGENLSSVLQSICEDPNQKRALLSWLEVLLPADVRDLEFPSDPRGYTLVTLVEKGGRRISADSASNGTLRYLALLAALLGPEPARFNFIEEIENGIHPTRLYLLTQMIEQRVKEGDLQAVATSHSPQLLAMLRSPSTDDVSVTYRLDGSDEARIKRIVDIPGAAEVLRTESLLHLQESGWFEDALSFMEPEAVRS